MLDLTLLLVALDEVDARQREGGDAGQVEGCAHPSRHPQPVATNAEARKLTRYEVISHLGESYSERRSTVPLASDPQTGGGELRKLDLRGCM